MVIAPSSTITLEWNTIEQPAAAGTIEIVLLDPILSDH